MTRRDIAQLDPENQRVVRLVRSLAMILVGSVLFLAAVIGWTIDRGEDTRSIVTRVSACERDARGEECQRIRREAEKGETVRELCRRFWRVGYPCPKPDSGVTIRSMRGGDASQPAPVAGQLPGPAPAGGGNRGSKQQQGRGAKKPAPEKPDNVDPPEPSPAPAPITTPSVVQPEPKGPPEHAQGPPESLPEAAGKAVENVLGKVCSLAERLAKTC